MYKYILLILTFAPLQTYSQTKRVLYLGNSYTYANNMPQIVADIASSMNDTLLFDSNTPGGYTLQGHSTNAVSLEKISKGTWDFVVLQEQSQRPALSLNQVVANVFPYAKTLDSFIHEYNLCCETMFFMTWGRKNGDSYYCPEWPPVCTYEGMDSLLRLRYMMMADSNNAVVSPVGAVWRHIRECYPEIELYTSDESHPSPAGSYAAACCFYTAIFQEDPTLISYNFTLNDLEANKIKNATKLVVYDSLLNWHIGEYQLHADFDYEKIEGNTYQFYNLSQNADSFLWMFDEETDTTENPIYTFETPEIHNILLTAYNSCDTSYSNQSIIIEPSNIRNDKFSKFSFSQENNRIVFENLPNGNVDIQIFDISGRKKYEFTKNLGRNAITPKLPRGTYIIKLKDKKEVFTEKIIVW